MKERDIPLEIWLLIFQYATYIPESTSVQPLDPFQPSRFPRTAMGANTPVLSMKTKCSLVLVCRSWRQIATELLYEHLVIRSFRRAVQVLLALRSSLRTVTINGIDAIVSEYGQWVKHIEIHTQSRAAESNRFAESLFRVFQVCPNVRILSGTWGGALPRWLIAAIPRFYGPKLQLLHWDSLSYALRSTNLCTLTPEFLTAFQSLRTLDMRKFGGWTPADYGRSNLALPRLSHLLLTTNETTLRTATSLVLPSLSHVILEVPFFHPMPMHLWNFDDSDTMFTPLNREQLQAFLAAHGLKISSLELLSSPMYLSADETNPDAPLSIALPFHRLNIVCFLLPGVCPNLRDLVFCVHEHVIDVKVLPEPHLSLRRIGLRGVSGEAISPERINRSQAVNHLYSFRRKHFPSLEVIRTLGFYGDAMEQGTLDVFIHWTECFEKRGVDFQDGEGVVWLWTDDEDEGEQTLEKAAERLDLANNMV
ncbi:hypothetical protein NEOLEDRAFT_1086166 [Neolentinus lepideus HHB14362 ss-1]|uniref:Uncharacterized protein n=1 Tax=Neolentinus lepideus HHB14362 ss-1 TaxID=1314782 RepID=A0A165V584_9AGAM|nr:hypothetical protein NEOLEDRAFT_1086166 [Neolentinus lepideus HHB14362 ss-1]